MDDTTGSTKQEQALVAIKPSELHQFWRVIAPGIAQARCHSGSNWIPEDIYAALRAGHSQLFIGYVECAYAGFAITTLVPGFSGPDLHFWIVFNASKHDVIARFMGEFEKMAESAGAKRMTFWSKRHWARRLRNYGFEVSQTEFVKEL